MLGLVSVLVVLGSDVIIIAVRSSLYLLTIVPVCPLQLQADVFRVRITDEKLGQAEVDDVYDVRNGDGGLGDVR